MEESKGEKATGWVEFPSTKEPKEPRQVEESQLPTTVLNEIPLEEEEGGVDVAKFHPSDPAANVKYTAPAVNTSGGERMISPAKIEITSQEGVNGTPKKGKTSGSNEVVVGVGGNNGGGTPGQSSAGNGMLLIPSVERDANKGISELD